MQVSSRQHMTVTLDEIKESRGKCLHRPRHCATHQKMLKIYCCTCNELICDICTDVHSLHQRIQVSDVQAQLRGRLKELLSPLQELSEKVRKKKGPLAELVDKHKTNVATIHAKVDSAINGLVELLKKRQVEIHSEIDGHAEQEKESILAEVKDVEQTLTWLTGSISFIDRMLKTASDYDLVAMGPQVIEQCKTLQRTQLEQETKELSEWYFDEIDDNSRDEIAKWKPKIKQSVKEDAQPTEKDTQGV